MIDYLFINYKLNYSLSLLPLTASSVRKLSLSKLRQFDLKTPSFQEIMFSQVSLILFQQIISSFSPFQLLNLELLSVLFLSFSSRYIFFSSSLFNQLTNLRFMIVNSNGLLLAKVSWSALEFYFNFFLCRFILIPILNLFPKYWISKHFACCWWMGFEVLGGFSASWMNYCIMQHF